MTEQRKATRVATWLNELVAYDTLCIGWLVQSYYRSGTGICSCTGAGQTLHIHSPAGSSFPEFSARNDVMAAMSKLRHQVQNPTPSTDAYLLEDHSCQTSHQSKLKQWSLSLGIFRRGRPSNKKKNDKSKMISDMRSVPDLK